MGGKCTFTQLRIVILVLVTGIVVSDVSAATQISNSIRVESSAGGNHGSVNMGNASARVMIQAETSTEGDTQIYIDVTNNDLSTSTEIVASSSERLHIRQRATLKEMKTEIGSASRRNQSHVTHVSKQHMPDQTMLQQNVFLSFSNSIKKLIHYVFTFF